MFPTARRRPVDLTIRAFWTLFVDATLLAPKHRSFRQIELARYRLRRAVRTKQEPRRVVHMDRVRILGFRIIIDDLVYKVSRVRQAASQATGFHWTSIVR
jgi:hypothetical protein